MQRPSRRTAPRLPWIEYPWHDRIADEVGAGGRLLDLGCGSGYPVAAHYASRGLHVTGIDSAPQMIALCRARLPDHEFRVADMRGLALGERFDAVIAWDSFFHLSRDAQRAMFAIFAAHARPGALLLFSSGPRDGIAMGSSCGDPLFHASLAPQEYRALLDRAGFDVVVYEPEATSAGGRTVWLARMRG